MRWCPLVRGGPSDSGAREYAFEMMRLNPPSILAPFPLVESAFPAACRRRGNFGPLAVVVDQLSSSLMPYFGDHRRAISVAPKRSFCAPVVISLNDLFSRPAAEQHREFTLQLRAGGQVALFGREVQRVAEDAEATSDDRNLVDGILTSSTEATTA